MNKEKSLLHAWSRNNRLRDINPQRTLTEKRGFSLSYHIKLTVTDVFRLASQFLLIPEAYGKFLGTKLPFSTLHTVYLCILNHKAV